MNDETPPPSWVAAYRCFIGIDLRFGFASKEEAAMWLLVNIARPLHVGVFPGDHDSVKKYVEATNRQRDQGAL
jgi:hypothetical protein